MKNLIIDIISRHTNVEQAQVEQDIDRDYFMSADEAREYGIVDEVVEPLITA